jgi:hypothetical protein
MLDGLSVSCISGEHIWCATPANEQCVSSYTPPQAAGLVAVMQHCLARSATFLGTAQQSYQQTRVFAIVPLVSSQSVKPERLAVVLQIKKGCSQLAPAGTPRAISTLEALHAGGTSAAVAHCYLLFSSSVN